MLRQSSKRPQPLPGRQKEARGRTDRHRAGQPQDLITAGAAPAGLLARSAIVASLQAWTGRSMTTHMSAGWSGNAKAASISGGYEGLVAHAEIAVRSLIEAVPGLFRREALGGGVFIEDGVGFDRRNCTLLTFLASAPTPAQMAAFAPDPELQHRLQLLLERSHAHDLTATERAEPDERVGSEHVLVMLTTGARSALTAP